MVRRYSCVRVARRASVPCKTMKEELAAVEQFGADLGEQSPVESYMFNKDEDIDMDAFHDRYLDKQKLGASSDAASYFSELSSRFGFQCKSESAVEPSPASSTPSSIPPVAASEPGSTT